MVQIRESQAFYQSHSGEAEAAPCLYIHNCVHSESMEDFKLPGGILLCENNHLDETGCQQLQINDGLESNEDKSKHTHSVETLVHL